MPPRTISRRDIDDPGETRRAVREFAEHAFSRAAEAPAREGNVVRLLKDATENYPAWLDAIRSARQTVHFECYIIHDDQVGRVFADALIERARAGVRVRLLYDWLGAFGAASPRFWNRMRREGVEVRCYNPPRLDSLLGWVSRDHRKVLSVDGERAFVAGLCVGQAWIGDPERHREPWRDTGVELRGPAILDLERAFAEVWTTAGRTPIVGALPGPCASADHGDVPVRVISTVPSTAKLFRLDQLVAALARERLWLSDAYYAGAAPYVQALRAAARDGVDVRLLVPGASDIPVLRPISRAGYRPLLDAGVRVFEWNGTMMHAKTAVADGQWARVGSSNLNPASWLGNCELDVMVEDERFARRMEEMYVDDLAHATEILLDPRGRVRVTGGAVRPDGTAAGGSSGRAAAAALRMGNAVAAAVSDGRVLEPVEAQLLLLSGTLFLLLGIVALVLPIALSYGIGVLVLWIAVSLLYRGAVLQRRALAERRFRRGVWHNAPAGRRGA